MALLLQPTGNRRPTSAGSTHPIIDERTDDMGVVRYTKGKTYQWKKDKERGQLGYLGKINRRGNISMDIRDLCQNGDPMKHSYEKFSSPSTLQTIVALKLSRGINPMSPYIYGEKSSLNEYHCLEDDRTRAPKKEEHEAKRNQRENHTRITSLPPRYYKQQQQDQNIIINNNNNDSNVAPAQTAVFDTNIIDFEDEVDRSLSLILKYVSYATEHSNCIMERIRPPSSSSVVDICQGCMTDDSATPSPIRSPSSLSILRRAALHCQEWHEIAATLTIAAIQLLTITLGVDRLSG
ncbi:hypothetical protein KIN20_002341 [Parelaphostrongylus tenuis]|uniref:Uncharacterized protein n=1 Tax=Parelaphostrongylus tenuis TaxID=148309 RepID=A0AAD5LZN0_PARTN|nr:hypothetical protein KIN20_002341 [Parelaphostrongylus tenuis]